MTYAECWCHIAFTLICPPGKPKRCRYHRIHVLFESATVAISRKFIVFMAGDSTHIFPGPPPTHPRIAEKPTPYLQSDSFYTSHRIYRHSHQIVFVPVKSTFPRNYWLCLPRTPTRFAFSYATFFCTVSAVVFNILTVCLLFTIINHNNNYYQFISLDWTLS